MAAGPVLIIASMLALLSVAGCGATQDASAPGRAGSGSELDEGTAVTVEQAGIVEGEEPMTAADMPTDTGTLLTYATNVPGDAVNVDFNLDGPWSFIQGPNAEVMASSFMGTEAAPMADQFGSADLVSLLSWSPNSVAQSAYGAIVASQYHFEAKSDSGLVSYGRFGPDDRLRTYSGPVRILVFPLATGTSWTESYTEDEDGASLPVIAENTVLSRNRLKVPAGEFEAFLLQSRVTSGSGDSAVVTWDYVWLVPGIGRAAEIISFPGERSEEFSQARFFYRLQDFSTS